ncbi:MAG TPA: DUF4382 domain-containing protein [Bacteroidia bacterium]|jgi:hypothetical protein|nr:DUF4382 domain-containing protein [Bacteroidia bacterium]
MKTKVLTYAMIPLCIFFFNGCMNETGTGSIRVVLKDAPASYQQVNVEIRQVSVHMDGGPWIDLPTQAGIYDLLLLQNGIDSTLVTSAQLPAGTITQMRLLLGSHNTVMADSVLYDLAVPSGLQTGLKLPGPITVPGNTSIVVTLDFVANESVIETGNGSYQLKPVIRVQ